MQSVGSESYPSLGGSL